MDVRHKGRDQKAGGAKNRRAQSVRHRPLFMVACLVAALVISFAFPLVVPPILAGDGSEYLLMIQALVGHQTPDLRPADIEALDRMVPGNPSFSKRSDPYSGFRQAGNGRWYSMHFWLYPLLAVPAHLMLQFAGADGFSALQVTNTIGIILTAGFVLLYGHGPWSRRLLFLALSAVGPVLWFLRWPHPEVFTWCCVVTALTLFGKKRYGWAAAAAALGSAQNPPLLLLALLPAATAITRRQGRQAVAAMAGLIPAFLPPLFYFHHFGAPSLIAHNGGVKFTLISVLRTRSFLFDLSQGMLPYVPLLVLLGLLGALTALLRRHWADSALAAVTTGMILLIETAPNWNNATAGPLRYVVWIVPLFAWLAVEQLPFNRKWLRVLLAVGLIFQAGRVVSRDGGNDYLRPTSLASGALDRFPSLVHPDPEIFAERQMRRECHLRSHLPIGFVGRDGSLIKVLTTEEALPTVARRCGLRNEEVADLSTCIGYPFADLVYLHPPRGRIKVVEPVGWGGQALQTGIHWLPVNLPGAILEPQLSFQLEVTNRARFRFWGASSGARYPLTFVCQVFEDGRQVSTIELHSPFSISPGQTVLVPVTAHLPRRTAAFSVEIKAALKDLVWDERVLRIDVEVLDAEKKSFLARVRAGNETQWQSGSLDLSASH